MPTAGSGCISWAFSLLASTAYFSAVAQPKPAIAGSLLRGAVAIIPCAVTLARLFGLNGVWLSFLASEMITFFAILLLAKLGHTSKKS